MMLDRLARGPAFVVYYLVKQTVRFFLIRAAEYKLSINPQKNGENLADVKFAKGLSTFQLITDNLNS